MLYFQTMAKFAVQGEAAEIIYDKLGTDAKSMSKGGNLGVSLSSGTYYEFNYYIIVLNIHICAYTCIYMMSKGETSASPSRPVHNMNSILVCIQLQFALLSMLYYIVYNRVIYIYIFIYTYIYS